MLTPNAQRLLRALVMNGPAYRADLARTLDVSRATVTNLTSRLQADGWIEEPDHEPGLLKNLIGTSPRLGVLGSIMFLVDTCTVTLSGLDGRLLGEFTLLGSSGTSAADRMAAGADLVDRLMAEHDLPASSLRALHLAVDTQMDARSGDIYAQRASSRWFGVNPMEYFATRLGVPVYVQNSARLEGLAEYLWGTGRGHSNMLYVEVSYGVTSGHIAGGIIQSGARGGAGELGHTVYDWNGPLCTCGNAGCLMQYVSIPAVLRDYETATGVRVDWADFCALVTAEDGTATSLAKRAATVLGRILVNTCHVLDPEVVVISGQIALSLPSFVDDVATTIREHALPLVGRNVEVLRSQLADLHTATARAGIDSLRAIDEVVTAVTTI
ncbi:ROK family transcriptional regulator [Microterricola viridarii]|nr:ROK family transcriptional regulator [Microterricola viridarii]